MSPVSSVREALAATYLRVNEGSSNKKKATQSRNQSEKAKDTDDVMPSGLI